MPTLSNFWSMPDAYYLNFVQHDPITRDKWLDEYIDMTDIEALARMIIGEDSTYNGMKGVAKVIQNRYIAEMCIPNLPVTGQDGTLHRHIITGDPDALKPWHSIIGDGEFTPLNRDATTPLACLNPVGEQSLEKWKYAVDLARCLKRNVCIADTSITNEMFFHGLGASTPASELNGVAIAHLKRMAARGTELEYSSIGGDDPDNPPFLFQVEGQTSFYNRGTGCWNSTAAEAMNFLAEMEIGPPDVGDVPLEGYGAKTGFPKQYASEFIEFLKTRVGCGYTLGTYGQICTQALLERRANSDTSNPSSYYLVDCARWMGRLVADCSGLIKWFLVKKGVNNCDTNSNGMYKNWCSEGSTDMSRMPLIPGTIVFKRNSTRVFHIGIYVGKDRVIEAKGALFGVVVSQLSTDSGWNCWGKFDWLNYNLRENECDQLPIVSDALTYGPLPGYPNISMNSSEAVSFSGGSSYTGPVYKLGMTDNKIEMIRRRLWADNKNFLINNMFDEILDTAIRNFQTSKGLVPDGLVGGETWRALFPVLKKQLGQQDGAKAMQTLLNYQNYSVGTPDGLFGSGTETVFKAYQADHELDPDGICGDKTWESLTMDEPSQAEVIVNPNGSSAVICKLGDSGNSVRQVQRRLAQQYNLPIDGIFGTTTENAVKAFQSTHSVTADGVVGPVTWKLIFPFLKIGRGTKDEVIALQNMLYYQKHIVIVDGIFGQGTDSAVKAYQTMRGLTVDGQVGDMTWESLSLSTPMSGYPISFGSGSSGSANSSTLIRPGDVSTKVRQVKRRLSADGGYAGTINNVYGSDLQYTVQIFQSNQNVTVDGIIGPVTWKLLFPTVKKQSGQQAGARAVQVLLNLNRFSVGTPDGLFGTGSETQLKAFQSAIGLTPDGICGENTWAKLCAIQFRQLSQKGGRAV